MKNLLMIATLFVSVAANAQQLHSIKAVTVCAASYSSYLTESTGILSTGTSIGVVSNLNDSGNGSFADQSLTIATDDLFNTIGSQEQNPNFYNAAVTAQSQQPSQLCHTFNTNANDQGGYVTNYQCTVDYKSGGGDYMHTYGEITNFADAARTLYEQCRDVSGSMNNSLCMDAAFVQHQINCHKVN